MEESGFILAASENYQANAASALYPEVRTIVLKTIGPAEPLAHGLKPLSAQIRAAFVYGSVAKAIDVMVISDATRTVVFGALERASPA